MNTKPKGGSWASRPMLLKDGFYVCLKNKGTEVMMHSRTAEDMQETADRYSGLSGKQVTIMGERLNNKWVNESKAPRKKKGEDPE